MNLQEIIEEVKNKIEASDQFKFVMNNSPGLYLAFESKKTILFEMKKGVEDIDSGKKIDRDSVFLAASLTKPVINNFILSLNILDKKVSTFIKCNHSELNIGHLLEHRSGLRNFLEYINEDDFNQLSLEELVSIILSKELEFNLGEKQEYSNSGYVILSRIIEIIFKKRYEDVLENYYMKKGIHFDFGPHPKRKVPSCYILEKDNFVKARFKKYQYGWGAGSLITSPKEYLKFINSTNYKKTLIKCKGPYGIGYHHTGGSSGVSTFIFCIEKYDLNLILFTNFDNYDHQCIFYCITNSFDWTEY